MAERRTWRPTPLIRASAALHGAAAVGVLLAPAVWPWALGAVAGNHALLGVAGLWPRCRLLGPNLTRLPARNAALGHVGLTFDDGPDPEVTPAVLDLLDGAGARASFFCIARRAERHPGLLREILRRGHTVENHSWRHPYGFAAFGPRAIRREVERAQAALEHIGGHRPRFFRPPAGLRNPLLEPVLADLGLRLASWTRRGYDGVVSDPALVAHRLHRGLAAGDLLLLHDRRPVRAAAGRAVVLDVLPGLLSALIARGLAAVSLDEVRDER